MQSLCSALCLGWALALAFAHPLRKSKPWHREGSQLPLNDTDLAQRCADESGFDAVTLDETGTILYFKGDSVWKGFHGHAEPLNASWPELQGPIDAALRIHYRKRPDIHDNVYLFQGEKVWAYAKGRLQPGYPRLIGEEFLGVPGGLDSAVECHPEECKTETILFFKGPDVFSYDLETRILKPRAWSAASNCSAALRWLERYYCFQGIRFLRFDPVTGAVPAHYPLDARDYFLRCPGRGHGHHVRANAMARAVRNPCSGLPFQAFTTDASGKTYAFREGQYFRVDSRRDGFHSWPLNHTWKGLNGEVEAAFNWDGKFYLIQGSQVAIYRTGQGYTLVEGYPRSLKDELGITEADATFICPPFTDLYVIKGSRMQRIDMMQSPQRPGAEVTIPHAHVDSATCQADRLFLFNGPDFHRYVGVAELTAAQAPAPTQNIASNFFKCPPAGATAPPAPPHTG